MPDDNETVLVFLKELWPTVVGPQVAVKSRPRSLEGKTLIVAVADATWERELSDLRSDLVTSINNLWSRRLVERIGFHVSPNMEIPSKEKV